MSTPATGRAERGQATVEVALALPVLVLALLLVLQVALVGRAHLLTAHAAREGARVAAVDGRAGAPAAAARRTPGLRADRLRVEVGPRGETVRVTVRYRVPTEVAIVGPLLGEPEVQATVVMRVEEPP